MMVRDCRAEYSERFYAALMFLYPAAFRVRFGSEMMQVFRASYRREARRGESLWLFSFWLRTLKDLGLSLAQEQGRQFVIPVDSTHPLVALIDSMLIPTIVGINLLVLGPVTTALLLHMEPSKVPADQFFTTSAIASLILGGLGVLRAVLMARLRPNVRLWVKLS